VGTPPQLIGCAFPWFFSNIAPMTCSASEPVPSRATIQYFQNGVMIWVESQAIIYVIYNDATYPRWQVFANTFVEGMPENDPSLDAAAPPNTFQPRRGFGDLWRKQPTVLGRIGWATQADETLYVMAVQSGVDGAIYLLLPDNTVLGLFSNGANWQVYR
jgi:hypothetical protein